MSREMKKSDDITQRSIERSERDALIDKEFEGMKLDKKYQREARKLAGGGDAAESEPNKAGQGYENPPLSNEPSATPAPSGEAAMKQWLKERGIGDQLIAVRNCIHQRQWLYELLTAWGDRCRREALREAAKATCDYCQIDGDPEDFINHPDPSGDGGLRWIHTGLDDGNSECMAQEIWNCISSAKSAALTPPTEPKETK